MPLFQQEQIRERADAKSYARGTKYYQTNAIFATVRRGNEIEGLCQGSSYAPYRVHATLDEDGNILVTSCTCPYDWEGDCKHIVALLLAYAHEPDLFEEHASTADALAERSQDELIGLIRQMVERYPDLQVLINRPVPGRQSKGAPVDTAPLRRELRHALHEYEGWDDRSVHYTMSSVAKTAREFADAGRWHDASAIYRTILEECLHKEQYPIDDEGEYIWALNSVLEAVIECLAQDEIANDEAERGRLLDHLLDAFIWDVDMGGQGLGDGIVPHDLLPHIRPDDLPRIRERVLAAQQRKMQTEYGRWGAEAYAHFLMQLDALDSTNPEETLQRLREQGMYRLLFEKLLEMGRADEAISVASEHLTNSYEQFLVLPQLVAAGRGDEAVELAKASLHKRFDHRLAQWLAERYAANGDRNALIELWLLGMMEQPSVGNYNTLRQAAQAIDKWMTVRPLILEKLQQEKQYSVLTQVYLLDEEWDAAWETLEHAEQIRLYGVYGLDLEVAQKSQHARPQKAIPVFMKYAQQNIAARNRGAYGKAAAFLASVRDLYSQIDDEASWLKLIASLRAEFPRLRALQDELNKAGL